MKKNKTRLIYFNLFVFIASIFLSLVIGEIIARVFHLSKTFNSYPWQVQKAYYESHYNPEKNSLGWRDREFKQKKEKGVYRIACVGDSITQGYRIELKRTFPKLLENSLRRIYPDVEVMNLGFLRHGTEENLVTVTKIMEFSPDLIVYQFGLNDIRDLGYCTEVTQPKDSRPLQESILKKILKNSVLYYVLAERYNYLKLKMGRKHWSFEKWNTNDEMWEKEFIKIKNTFNKVSKSTRIMIINMPYDFQLYSNRAEVYIPSKKIGKFCQDNGYGFLDFTRIFKQQKGEYNIFLDDCHLTNRGHEIVAEYLKNYILSHYLSRRQ